MTAFGKRLISWYEKNKRDLPWRHTRDPYLVWLSEVILQQTRVDQGMSYYLRFREIFPDVHALASAPLDLVLKNWQGLGYYSRARNLHAAAQIVSQELGGTFPTTKTQIMKLKGIGDYTSSAIASFCFGEKVPVIDGNVIRVLSRLHAIDFPADTIEGKRQLHELAYALLDEKDPGTYNQAIMEFGALHCTPMNPGCDECPFRGSCRALALNAVSSFPLKKKKAAVKDVTFQYFILKTKQGVYLRKRGHDSIWKGLYDFPSTETADKPEVVITGFLAQYDLPHALDVSFVSEYYRHLLTHRKISARFHELRLPAALKNNPDYWIYVRLCDLKEYPIPRLIEKYLQERGWQV